MTIPRQPQDVGGALQDVCGDFLGVLYELEMDFQLGVIAFELLKDRLHAANDGDGIEIDLEPDSARRVEAVGPMLHRGDLVKRVIGMRTTHPARQSLYLLLEHFEKWQSGLIALSSQDASAERSLPFDRANDRIHEAWSLDVTGLPGYDRCRESRETRNCWTHNQGRIDDRYRTKAGAGIRVPVNDLLPVDEAYFKEVIESFRVLVAEAARTLQIKHPPRIPSDPAAAARLFCR